MPNPNISFQGQTLIVPGAYYADNVQGGGPNSPPGTPPLLFIGYSNGGKPNTAYNFTGGNAAQQLLNFLRGGSCSGFVPFLCQPSGQLNGAQSITYINASENTQSSLILSSATTGVVTLTSTNYGVPSNLLQAKVETGSIVGKKLTLYDGYSVGSIVGDNLGVPFQLAYTGAATGVTYTVATSGLNALTFTTSSPNAGESVSISLSAGQYATVEQVVQYLNGTGFYSAYVTSNGMLPSNYLDAATAVALAKPVSSVNQYVNVTAALGDVIYFVNQYAATAYATASGLVTGYVSGQALANIPFTPFAGATSVPPNNTDYTNALNTGLTVPAWAVFIDSNSGAVQALGAAHVQTASQTSNGRWRRFFTGSSIGDSVSGTIAAAQALNQINCTFCYPGIYRTNTQTGQNQLYSGLYVAAAAAGMATGNQVALPLTNKSLTGNGVEVNLTQTQINQLQQGGVLPIYVPQQTGVPTFVSDATTWQNDSNPENIFNQQIACRYWVAYSLVNALQPYVGTIASTQAEQAIYNAAVAALNALVYQQGNNGVINSWDPASLVLTYTGATQTLAVSVNVVLVGQNRFITIFTNILPLNLVLTGSNTLQG